MAPARLPTDPLDIASGLPWAFHLVGLEAAFNRAGGNRVLLLPLADCFLPCVLQVCECG